MSTLSATRRTLLWIGLPGLIVLGAVIWFISRPVSQAQIAPDPDAPVLATTTTVQQQDVPIYFDGVGTVNAWASVTVRPQIDGRLDSVGFEEGGNVLKGQLIAQLDARTQQALLDQALAQKAKDQALLVNARRDLDRYAGLVKLNAVARQTLDAQRAQVAQLEASLKLDEAQISYARTQLSYTRITAPISGRVGARLVDPGNIVHVTDPDGLVVINQVDPIAVVFTLPEHTFQAINRAQHERTDPLEVMAFSRDDAEVLGRGELVLVNNQIDVRTGTIRVKGRFSNRTHTLWPGQYVNARLVLGERRQVLTIPAESVLRGAKGTYTYVVDADDTVHVQPIRALVIQDGIAVIDEGLSPGQRIVIDGQYKLRPGLRITEAPQAAAGGHPS
ncbi:MAG: efflux RND transporter periplasmic adaptor subunit [Alcaligenaceae bacterium]|nr:efflux RND transporter periplasmic adaptor subunit [Alcaligenaceae bacterium]